MAAPTWVQLLPADNWFVMTLREPEGEEPLTVDRIVAWGLRIEGKVEALVARVSTNGTEMGSVVEPVREPGVFFKHLDSLTAVERELAGLPEKGVALGH
jgi:hypothetical protein